MDAPQTESRQAFYSAFGMRRYYAHAASTPKASGWVYLLEGINGLLEEVDRLA